MKAATPRPAHEVRIIGGRYRRSRLPVADRPGLRPTPDRVRETLFNWLGQDLTGWRCLDAFAGSGALGLEAASRGAARVVLVERDAQAAASLRGVQVRLGAAEVEILCADGLQVLAAQPPGSLDLIFLDPPYASGLLPAALQSAGAALAAGGFVHAESDTAQQNWPAGLEPFRQARAGRVHHHLLRRS